MRVVDTSALIEWMNRSQIGLSLRADFPSPAEWVMPTMVQLELVKWMGRSTKPNRADRVLAFTTRCIVVPLDTRIAVIAAEVSKMMKLSTADAVIYATALSRRADLLTCDAHFEGLPGVVFIPKRPPAP